MMNSPPTPEQLSWPSWAEATKPPSWEKKPELAEEFATQMKERANEIWTGMYGFSFKTPELHREIRRTIFRKANQPSAEILFADWWDRLIAAGNLAKIWKIPLRSPVVAIPQQRPQFVRYDFQLLREFRVVESAFWDLCREKIADSDLAKFSLLSAVINGGLLDSRDIAAFLALTQTAITGFAGRLLVTLSIEPSSEERFEKHWYPDTVTAAFLTRALKTGGIPDSASGIRRLQPTNAPEYIRYAVNKLGLSWSHNGLDFLRAARLAQSFRVTPVSVACQSGESATYSLPKEILFRLCEWEIPLRANDRALENDPEETSWRSHPFVDVKIEFDRLAAPKDQLKLISKFKGLLNGKACSFDDVDRQIVSCANSLWPVTRLLVEWVKWLMSIDSRGSAVRPSSAKRYLATVARHIIDVVEDEDPRDLDPEDLETMYELAAARIRSPKEVAVFWARARSLQDFFQICGAPEIDLSELDGYRGPGATRVSANLVSESHFDQFKASFMVPIASHSQTTWSMLAAILGFRCGLRRREIQMLWLSDVHLGDECVLIVRSSRLAALKSDSSERRIPLTPVLQPDELRYLTEYVERRRAVVGRTPCLLFSYDHQPCVPIPSAMLFDQVTAAFQALTANQTTPFRFHHLRHSFANWFFLALLAADQPNLIDPAFPLLNTLALSPSRTQAIKNHFFPRLQGIPETISRRNLYLVSAMLGHLSPQTTLKHYLHLMDWVAGQETDLAVQERLKQMGGAELGRLCGLSPSMPHKPPYRQYRDYPVQFMREFVRQSLPRSLVVRRVPAHKAPVDLSSIRNQVPPSSVHHPISLLIILARRIKGQLPERIEMSYGVPRDAIERAAQSYRYLYAKQKPNTPIEMLPVPLPPRNVVDRQVFHHILNRTYEAFKVESNRDALAVASELIIRRPGPTTGRLYPGYEVETAAMAVSGLIIMGVPPNAITLRCPACSVVLAPSDRNSLEFMEHQGVVIVDADAAVPSSARKAPTYIVEISDRRGTEPGASRRAEGRVKGVNYAAMWVKFAVASACSRVT